MGGCPNFLRIEVTFMKKNKILLLGFVIGGG